MGGEDMEGGNRKGRGGRGEGDETSGLLPPCIPFFWKTLRREVGKDGLVHRSHIPASILPYFLLLAAICAFLNPGPCHSFLFTLWCHLGQPPHMLAMTYTTGEGPRVCFSLCLSITAA